jgi:hypothetical protein
MAPLWRARARTLIGAAPRAAAPLAADDAPTDAAGCSPVLAADGASRPRKSRLSPDAVTLHGSPPSALLTAAPPPLAPPPALTVTGAPPSATAHQ